MAIQRLTEAQEERLMEGLDKIATDSEVDRDPEQVICKVAKELELPAGHVELLVRAFNTSQACRTRSNGDDYAEKSADAKLADPSIVLDRLFGTVKQASHLVADDVISIDYSFGPDWLDTEPVLRQYKQAASPLISPDKETLQKRAQAYCDRQEKEIERQRREILQLEIAINEKLHKTASYFDMPGRPSSGEVYDNLKRRWGDLPATVFTSAVGEVKKASARTMQPVVESAAPYCHVLDACRLLQSLKVKAAAFDRAMAEHQRLIDSDHTLFTKFERSTTKQAAGGISLPQLLGLSVARDYVRDMSQHFGEDDPESMVQKELQNLASPDHEAQLRDIQQRAMLQDLLANDQVLSQHDPHDLAYAFNSLSSMAPHAMGNAELARSVLRKRMELGQLEPMEIQQLTSIDSALKPMHDARTKLPAKPGSAPADNGSKDRK